MPFAVIERYRVGELNAESVEERARNFASSGAAVLDAFSQARHHVRAAAALAIRSGQEPVPSRQEPGGGHCGSFVRYGRWARRAGRRIGEVQVAAASLARGVLYLCGRADPSCEGYRKD